MRNTYGAAGANKGANKVEANLYLIQPRYFPSIGYPCQSHSRAVG